MSLNQVVHLSVGPLELTHSHGVQMVQDQTQAVFRQLKNVGVLVCWRFLVMMKVSGFSLIK